MGVFTTSPDDRLLGAGGTPTVAPGAVAGFGATATVVGNNKSGVITVKTGAASVGTSGVLVTLTLADGVTVPTAVVPLVQSFGSFSMATMVAGLYVQGTTNTAIILLSGVSLSVSTTYTFGYINNFY